MVPLHGDDHMINRSYDRSLLRLSSMDFHSRTSHTPPPILETFPLRPSTFIYSLVHDKSAKQVARMTVRPTFYKAHAGANNLGSLGATVRRFPPSVPFGLRGIFL